MSKKHRKAFGNLTIYGRKPVLEALQDNNIPVLRLHLSRSNKSSDLIRELHALARQRDIPVSEHGKLELSRISRNSRQDQGVAADLQCPALYDATALRDERRARHIIALDQINNPQNLGMIMRSVAASASDGLLLSTERGNTRLSPLVVKASAGTFFKTPVYRCDCLHDTLRELQAVGYTLLALDAGSADSLFDRDLPSRCIFVLGNESDGISEDIGAIIDHRVAIPMQRGVESLNVAVTAALVAFMTSPGS